MFDESVSSRLKVVSNFLSWLKVKSWKDDSSYDKVLDVFGLLSSLDIHTLNQ